MIPNDELEEWHIKNITYVFMGQTSWTTILVLVSFDEIKEWLKDIDSECYMTNFLYIFLVGMMINPIESLKNGKTQDNHVFIGEHFM